LTHPDCVDPLSGKAAKRVEGTILKNTFILLSDTELTEYIFEEIVGGDGAGDLAEVVQGELDVHREEVGGYSVHAAEHACERLFGFLEGLQVADVGYEGLVAG